MKDLKHIDELMAIAKPNKDRTLCPVVIHKRYNCEAFNFHTNQSGDDGNIYYNVQNKNQFLKFKLKNFYKIFEIENR